MFTILFLGYLTVTKFYHLYFPSFNQGKSCQDIKTTFPHAQDGMYQVLPDSGLKLFWVYCDMTSFDSGWTMCYSTDNLVNPKTEVTYNKELPYGTDGYRTDCNNIEVNSLRSDSISQREFSLGILFVLQ